MHNSTYWYFTCQHGVNECIGNMYEDCAIEHYPTVTNGMPAWWPFVLCEEKSGSAGNLATAQTCAKNNNIDWNVINTCAGSTPQYGTQADGNPWMHQTALNTINQQPPHQYTPWITVNGKVESTSASLTKLVCDAYTGTPPAGCTRAAEEVVWPQPKPCYRDEEPSL